MKNSKNVDFIRCGYGQWKAVTTYYGKKISMHFTEAHIYDLIISKERGYKKAINNLINRIIQANKTYKN